jgi:hypothetical protein
VFLPSGDQILGVPALNQSAVRNEQFLLNKLIFNNIKPISLLSFLLFPQLLLKCPKPFAAVTVLSLEIFVCESLWYLKLFHQWTPQRGIVGNVCVVTLLLFWTLKLMTIRIVECLFCQLDIQNSLLLPIFVVYIVFNMYCLLQGV